MNNQPTSPRTVFQSTYSWLPQTMTWLYHQTKNLEDWRSVVVCQDTANLDQFPWQDIYVVKDQGRLAYYSHKASRLLGTRRHPKLYEKAVDEHKPLLLHSHFGPQGWRDMLLAERSGLAHIVTFYGFDVKMLVEQEPIWRKRYTEMFASVSAVLCEGPHMADCVAELGCPREKLRVHHLGVDLEFIPFTARKWTPGEPFKVLIASAFNEKKGIPYGIEALGMFHKANPDIDLQVTIIGDATGLPASAKNKQTIIEMIDKWNITARTVMLGFQPHSVMIEEAYKNHLFLSPSVTASDGDTEGGAPVSIIELAASGMPVVSTAHCDIPHVLGNLNRDILVGERDSAALAAQISSLAANPESWEALVTQNRARIEAEFSAKDQGRALGRVYDEVVEAHRRSDRKV